MAKVVFVSFSKKQETLMSCSPSGVGLDENVGSFPRGGRTRTQMTLAIVLRS